MRVFARYILLVICLLSGGLCSMAQGLEFNENSWDFGEIAEMGGEVSHTFEFWNRGKSPVVLVNVRTTCGCTMSEYSREPIAVGASSKLEITFDPRYRPGLFRKSIYVHSSASSEPIRLSIMGYVSPRVLSIEERYPFALLSGGRLSEMYHVVSGVRRGELMQTSVGYYNDSKRAIDVEFKPRHDSKYLRILYNKRVEAGKSATIDIGYYCEGREDHSVVLSDTLDIYVNGRSADRSLFVRGSWAE